MELDHIVAHAVVGRAGLANLLFPWARCEIFSQTHGIRMLAPQWSSPKIGPMLRGERDLRYYVGLFNNKTYIHGVRKWLTLLRSTRVPEANAESALTSKQRTTVIFTGLGELFRPLLEHQKLTTRRLYEILSDKTKDELARQPVDFDIAVHIRKGDKPPVTLDQIPPTSEWGWTLPNVWYVNAIQAVRSTIGHDARVKIFSDGRPEQLSDVLALPKTKLADASSAIVDILMLSRAKVLITSPTSTFSWWGAFLGQMPTIWFRQWRQELHPGRPQLDIPLEDNGTFSEEARASLSTNYAGPV